MLETLPAAEPDRILMLIAMFRDDPRPEKIDLGVGVYRDAAGRTPVFASIREAQARLHAAEQTKTYVALRGDDSFLDALGALALGEDRLARAASAQGVGGTGAVWLLARLTWLARPEATAHLPAPTWPNHKPLMETAGLRAASYPYLDAAGRALDFAAMAAALEKVPAGDLVVLHACCHNPTGADPTPRQWREIAAIAARRGWTPLFDAAYLGFGDGLEEDAAGMRMVLDAVPEAMVALSCSKNFGLYRDRAGAAFALTASDTARERARASLEAINREHYSFPPDHGAALVRMTLRDDALRAGWEDELSDMRGRVARLRRRLAESLAARPGGQGWTFVGDQRGMFSLLGLSDAQVTRLREERAVYMAPGGRINVAGLHEDQADRLADALLSVV